jgi:hypothetical protein
MLLYPIVCEIIKFYLQCRFENISYQFIQTSEVIREWVSPTSPLLIFSKIIKNELSLQFLSLLPPWEPLQGGGGQKLPILRQHSLWTAPNAVPAKLLESEIRARAGVCCRPCNPSKWEADIWGWLEVRRSAILHYSEPASEHSFLTVWSLWGNLGWLGVQRWQLCLRDTSRGANCHRRAAVGHWVPLCVCSAVGWLIVYQLGILSLSCSQYSQTICWRRWDDNSC